MAMQRLFLGLLAASVAVGPCLAQPMGAPAMAATPIPLDQERMIDGVGVACSGIGQSKADPRWLSYSVRLEFSDPARDYLADEAVAVTNAAGQRLAAVKCEGPWILIKLPPGTYRVTGWLPGSPDKPVSAEIHAPAKGQQRFVLEFPNP